MQEGVMVMARVRALEKDCVTAEVLPIYEEIEKVFGRVPNIFKTYAHVPPLLKANWETPALTPTHAGCVPPTGCAAKP
jgi:hypothetical protein